MHLQPLGRLECPTSEGLSHSCHGSRALFLLAFPMLWSYLRSVRKRDNILCTCQPNTQLKHCSLVVLDSGREGDGTEEFMMTPRGGGPWPSENF